MLCMKIMRGVAVVRPEWKPLMACRAKALRRTESNWIALLIEDDLRSAGLLKPDVAPGAELNQGGSPKEAA